MNHLTPPPAHSSPQILQHLLQAYLLWQEFLNNFPKKSRYTLGAKIEQCFLDTLEAIFVASIQPREKKLPYLERAVIKFDTLKFFLQTAWESKALDNNKYVALSKPLEEIGRQLGGWYKNILTQTPARREREK